MNDYQKRWALIKIEDREAVTRLADRFSARYDGPSGGTASNHRIDCMQAALREFANPTPPKPPEPTGLGAVVRERHSEDGVDWVRVPLASNDERWFCGDTGEWREYADIDVVRVLSEGVTS
jgi:hypothetical protein